MKMFQDQVFLIDDGDFRFYVFIGDHGNELWISRKGFGVMNFVVGGEYSAKDFQDLIESVYVDPFKEELMELE